MKSRRDAGYEIIDSKIGLKMVRVRTEVKGRW